MTKSARIVIQLIFALAFLLSAPWDAQADAINCELEDRTMAFFRDTLPEEVKALIRCSSRTLKFNRLYVAKLKSAKKKDLISWFKAYEKSEVSESQKTILLEKRGSTAADTWMEFESAIENGKTTTHYLFTALSAQGSIIAFIYSDSKEQAQVRRGTIQSLMKTFRGHDFIETIAGALGN